MTFDPKQHIITGNALDAQVWVETSSLPESQKNDLLTFIKKFPTITFTKDDNALIDHYEKAGNLTLPLWFREIRCTLAFTEPGAQVQLDDFNQYNSPRADSVADIWYEIALGYVNDEQREMLYDKTTIYPIGAWWGTDHSCLAIDLKDSSNMQILEYAYEDLLDNDYDGRPIRGSLYPIYNSYSQFLAHITRVKLPDGTEITAKE